MTGWVAGGAGFSGRVVKEDVPFAGGGLIALVVAEEGLIVFGFEEFEARERSP